MCSLQVREYEYNAERQGQQEKTSQKLKGDVSSKRTQLEQWSSTAYGEVQTPIQHSQNSEVLQRFPVVRRSVEGAVGRDPNKPSRASVPAVAPPPSWLKGPGCCQRSHPGLAPNGKVHVPNSGHDRVAGNQDMKGLGCAGFQCLDPHLRHPAFHREHPAVWPAAQVPGLPDEAQPQADHQAAQAAGIYVWHQWCASNPHVHLLPHTEILPLLHSSAWEELLKDITGRGLVIGVAQSVGTPKIWHPGCASRDDRLGGRFQ